MKCKIHLSAALICLLLLTASSCKDKRKPATADGTPAGGIQTFTDTSVSSVRVFDQNGRICIQQSNTYYEMADLYEGATRIPLLLKIKKTELCFADSVNKHKVYEIEANSILDTKKIHWQNSFVATGIQFSDNSLLAVHEGVETEEDFLTRYSLADGKELFSCSYSEMRVKIPNVRDRRFIGFTSQKTATEPVQQFREENLFGVVRYSVGTGGGNAAKIILKRTKVAAKMPLYSPEMILVSTHESATAIDDGKTIVLMKADERYTPKDVTGFSVQFVFYYGEDNESAKILIPVVDDRLDISRAQYDKDIFEIKSF